jgi:hypothetical protein
MPQITMKISHQLILMIPLEGQPEALSPLTKLQLLKTRLTGDTLRTQLEQDKQVGNQALLIRDKALIRKRIVMRQTIMLGRATSMFETTFKPRIIDKIEAAQTLFRSRGLILLTTSRG